MVEFVVRVPHDTPHWEPVFLAGDGEALGNWHANRVRLQPWQDTHRLLLDIPPGTVRFLVTRGNWRSCENDGRGREHNPRELAIAGPMEVEFAVAGWGRHSVRYHHDVTSQFVPHGRTVSVYLPPGYDLDPTRRFPVLYLHDGQNLFDAHTSFAGVPWASDETAERCIRAGECEPVILVGVANTRERIHEYGPRRCGRGRAEDISRGYGRFLVEEVKPFIDRTYRTQPGPAHTGVGGASMGGLISLHLAKWYPGVFGKCAAMSPSLWWDREYFLRNVEVNAAWLRECRVWLDMGGREGVTKAGMAAGVRRTRRLAKLLKRHERLEGRDYRYLEVPKGEHNEAAWGGRFDQVLRFLFPASADQNRNADDAG